MNIETTSLGAGSYPEPKEEKTKTIQAKLIISYNIEYDVPENWNQDQIIRDIEDNLYCLEKCDEKIEEIEIK